MKFFKKCVLALGLIVGLTTGIYGQEKSSEFIRFTPGNEETSGLQIAVTEYVSSSTSASITLYGVVHVADESYYKKVQADLDKFDVVLYEGVKSGTQPNSETKILNTFQHLMGDVLDLKFQKDCIDYTRPNLVHADISIDKLQESLNGESITPMGQYLKGDQFDTFKPFIEMAGNLVKELLKQNPQLQNELKNNLGNQLSKADISEQLSPQLKKAIVLDRNQIVIETFQKQLKLTPEKKTYCVFYGAAHMPDLESRLKEMGFKEKSKRWMTAWKVTKVEEDDSEDDEKPRRVEEDSPRKK